MISWLGEVIIPFTLVAAVLLLTRRYLSNFYSPHMGYATWLLLPASLIVPFIELPNWFAVVSEGQSVQRYLAVYNAQPSSAGVELPLLTIWLAGVLSLLGFWSFQHLKLIKAYANWQPVTHELLQHEVLANSGLKAYRTQQNSSPALVGIVKPKLVIPKHFEQLYSKEQQQLILEHELCHFNRNDMVWNAIGLLIVALMWFHPLAWLAYSCFRRDQEISCDQTVLARKHTTCRINYSKALLVAAQASPPLGFAQLSFKEYGDKNVMFERINMIKQGYQQSKLASVAVLAGALSIMSAISYAGDGYSTSDTHKSSKKMSNLADHIKPTVRIEPKYPIQAARDRVEGSVVLKFNITPSGSVSNISVVKAIPENVFNKVATTALAQWQYETSTSGSTNNLVQLDFMMDDNSNFNFANLTEQITVNK